MAIATIRHIRSATSTTAFGYAQMPYRPIVVSKTMSMLTKMNGQISCKATLNNRVYYDDKLDQKLIRSAVDIGDGGFRNIVLDSGYRHINPVG